MLYRVLQPMMLHPGALLGLTAAQAAARSFGLVPQGAKWLVTKPVGFKAGEEIEVDGGLPKALAQSAAMVGGAAEAATPAQAPARRKRVTAAGSPATAEA